LPTFRVITLCGNFGILGANIILLRNSVLLFDLIHLYFVSDHLDNQFHRYIRILRGLLFTGRILHKSRRGLSPRNAAMPSKLSKHLSPPNAPDFLSHDQPDSIPGIYDLEVRLEALEKMKLKHLERKKQAQENLRAGEEEIRRIKEREKGKSKAVEKIKHERNCT
jgi:hypothetical protein